MKVVPLVVTTGLLVSLIEAFWILPSHVISTARRRLSSRDQLRHWRGRWTHRVRVKYTKALAFVFRRPARFFAVGLLAFLLSLGGVVSGAVKVDFFLGDPFELFYINVDQLPESPIEATLDRLNEVQTAVRPLIRDDELRAMTGMAGLRFTEVEILYGDHYGQIQVGLTPRGDDDRSTEDIVDAVRQAAIESARGAEVSFFVLTGGPPAEKDISVNVRGDDLQELRAATATLKQFVRTIPGAENVIDDEVAGRFELTLDLDYRAIREAGLSPGIVSRLLRLHLDGEIIAFTRDGGEKVELRVRGPKRTVAQIEAVLDDPIVLPGGGTTTFRALTTVRTERGSGTIKHYNYRRSISIQGDIGPNGPDTISGANMIAAEWARIRVQYPGVDIDFAGAFDDIQESLDSMLFLFLFGLGLIYLILATQFKSYFQPMLILITVPMAFTGVVFGLFVTGQALSLFTLYGVVALTGIAVNAAIVLIDATNSRIASGMRPLHAVMYAARRRVIPILMTSLTTIAGLFSLATGLGGRSAIWGPVAASMVFGLLVATTLTLFLVPVLARSFLRLRDHRVRNAVLGLVSRWLPDGRGAG
jgi:multidrug efflux pump subunit AcrB